MPVLARRRFLVLCAAAGLGAACGDGGGPPQDGARTRISYGDHDEAFGDLWLPERAPGPVPVVVLVHGGFWRQEYDLGLMDPLAESLVDAGYAAWNIEYRRVDGAGGYPQTFDDVAAAVDHLAELGDARLDLDRVAVVGHSAGGHLAAWIAGRPSLPDDAPWARPAVRPVVAFPQAGVLDLVGCAREDLGVGACQGLVGGDPEQRPGRYALVSPTELVPIGVPVIAVHGRRDPIVPLSQSETYVDAAVAAGDPAELVVLDDADHMDLIDPGHQAWAVVLDGLRDHLS
jgi:acetyl esterase/lipase